MPHVVYAITDARDSRISYPGFFTDDSKNEWRTGSLHGCGPISRGTCQGLPHLYIQYDQSPREGINSASWMYFANNWAFINAPPLFTCMPSIQNFLSSGIRLAKSK